MRCCANLMERNVGLIHKGDVINLAKSHRTHSLIGDLGFDEIPRILGTSMHVAMWKISLSNHLQLADNYIKTR